MVSLPKHMPIQPKIAYVGNLHAFDVFSSVGVQGTSLLLSIRVCNAPIQGFNASPKIVVEVLSFQNIASSAFQDNTY